MQKLLYIVTIAVLLGKPFTGYSGNESNTVHYEKIFAKANTFYSEGNFKEALNLYLSISDAGYTSYILFYNTGNCYYKLNDIPSAILFYEKAKKLRPNDGDIEFNLQIANQKITDKIDALPEIFTTQLWKNFANTYTPNNWAWRFIILLIIGFSALSVYVLTSSAMLKKIAFYAAIFSFIVSVLSYMSGQYTKQQITKSTEAVILSPSTNIKSEPQENSTSLFVVHAGTKVKLFESVNGWIKISLANGHIGWIKKEDIREI